ncbi:NUDIX hydrolase [Burkholderia ambifaria]|uniref:NUDIX hydrolase n=1 Tax=Burkholderia ambifaria MEX-5 TaxID=396597 RepID=B1T8M4_9BURK|nr:NUDIX hydrolase [Burkholderia ambifaria]EDT40086.1 NUDIX hydrolase [Burkholderia ambifaria MEX-5]
MASVYAVLHDENGAFLMAQKRAREYYVHTAYGGRVDKDGWPLTNGGGRYALPGGALDEADIEKGAAREFFEETGLTLPVSALRNPRVVKFDGSGQVVSANKNFAFAAVYFKVSEEDVIVTENNISEFALPNSKRIVVAIESREIKAYSEIQAYARKHGMVAWPADNELDWVWRWNVYDGNDWNAIRGMRGDPQIGWYYSVLEYLRDHILR